MSKSCSIVLLLFCVSGILGCRQSTKETDNQSTNEEDAVRSIGFNSSNSERLSLLRYVQSKDLVVRRIAMDKIRMLHLNDAKPILREQLYSEPISGVGDDIAWTLAVLRDDEVAAGCVRDPSRLQSVSIQRRVALAVTTYGENSFHCLKRLCFSKDWVTVSRALESVAVFKDKRALSLLLALREKYIGEKRSYIDGLIGRWKRRFGLIGS